MNLGPVLYVLCNIIVVIISILGGAADPFSSLTPVSLFIYQNPKLFQSRRIIRESLESDGEFKRIVGSRVIAATVEGVHVTGLTNPVVSAFEILEVIFLDIYASTLSGENIQIPKKFYNWYLSIC